MLRLYNAKGEYAGTLTHAINQHRCRTLADGDETLNFEYPHGENTEKIEVEGYVRTDKQEYVIKSIVKETSDTTISVECALNIEDLEGKAAPGGFETVEKTLSECMSVALNGTGWTCNVDQKITKRRTVRIDDDTNVWKIIQAAVSTYKVELRVETLEKCVYFVETRGEDKGCYFFEGLNLRSLGVEESSYGFYTRLIPIGKDGLHLWIDEKNYIENHQYSPKTITAVWRDDRYTNTTSLYEDAVARLEEASKPVTAYTGDLIDLAKQSGKYKVLDYDLGDVIILASRTMEVWEKQRIVKIDEYDHWEKNTVELSSATKTFAQIQKEGDDLAKKEAINVTGRIFQEKLTDGYYTKEEVSTAIRALEDSIELEVKKTYMTKAEGERAAEEARKAAEEAGESAKKYTDGVIVGYYTKSEVEAKIEVATDEINLGVSKTYATTTWVKEIDAESAKNAENNANNYTTERLTEYSTTEQMKAAIKVAADEIDLGVSKIYTTKVESDSGIAQAKAAAAADATAKANAAKEAATKHTDETLKNYSTTVQMQAAIKIVADQISSKVSKGEVESIIAQKADSIRLKASKISWDSTYSSMTEDGKLTCSAADIKGVIECGSQNGYWMRLGNAGKLEGGYGGNQVGTVNCADFSGGMWGMGIKAENIIFEGDTWVYDGSGCWSRGADGWVTVVSELSIEPYGNGGVTWSYNFTDLEFQRGMCVTIF